MHAIKIYFKNKAFQSGAHARKIVIFFDQAVVGNVELA